MKQLVMIMMALLTFSYATAQNIKIKKGNILLNKKDKIGTVEKYRSDDGKSHKIVNDLNGNALDIWYDNKNTEDVEDDSYLVTSNFNNGMMQIHPFFLKGLSTEKSFTKYLMEKNLWQPKSGFNISELNKEFESNQKLVSEANNERDRVMELDVFVKRNGDIVIGGNQGTEVIGYVESPDHYLKTIVDPILIYDLDRNLIAKGKSEILTDEKFKTFDGEEHHYKIKNELNELLMPLFLSEVVQELMLGGYIYQGDKPYDKTLDVLNK